MILPRRSPESPPVPVPYQSANEPSQSRLPTVTSRSTIALLSNGLRPLVDPPHLDLDRLAD
jgi:hypothetical protein